MLKQRKWMKENLGFTLVELIIVMGIMGHCGRCLCRFDWIYQSRQDEEGGCRGEQ